MVATKITHIESDGGWLRRCRLNTTVAGYRVDEDRDNDNERSHVAERGALLVFSRNFDATFLPDLRFEKSQQILSDPYSTANFKAIPGETIIYTLTATNQGFGTVGTDSFLVTDPIPVNGSLVVNDVGLAGSGPVLYSDGTEPSTLTYTYINLASTLDDLSFSDDGGATFNYTPTADANGTDPAVTHLRVNMQGTFVGITGTTAPSSQIEFHVKVD